MSENNIFNFENLKVYQKALDYVDFVYELTDKLPSEEKYSLAMQWRRASNSVALNIAEGESGTIREFANFLRISRRSIRECVVCTTISLRRNYINKSEADVSRVKLVELAKMNSGLSRSLQSKLSASIPDSPLLTPHS